MMHTDVVVQLDGAKRRIAYVLHMSKNWNATFGGDFIYVNPRRLIHAGLFNYKYKFTLFLTTFQKDSII